uniref:Uncharacterized protein n=1 Tax=Anguilla anguilla TaxID=7936 RepID=A0A0E9X5G8_ANGAN
MQSDSVKQISYILSHNPPLIMSLHVYCLNYVIVFNSVGFLHTFIQTHTAHSHSQKQTQQHTKYAIACLLFEIFCDGFEYCMFF